MSDRPVACGVAIVVTHRQRVLFGKRRTKSTGYEWQLPGGWIQSGETPLQAAERELREETGLAIREPCFVGVTSNRFSTDEHSISLYFEARCVDPRRLDTIESAKCISWEWLTWDEPGGDLYLPLRLFRQTGYRPFSSRGNKTWVSL